MDYALGFRVYELGFRVYEVGFRVYELGFRVYELLQVRICPLSVPHELLLLFII